MSGQAWIGFGRTPQVRRDEWRYLKGEHPHADWELFPTSSWNVALVNPTQQLANLVCEVPGPGETPFSPKNPPFRCELPGRLVPGWEIEHNAAGPVPASPVAAGDDPVTVTLIPYGATNLRIG